MKTCLLLIDDEPIILNGLKNAVNWQTYGIDRILLANDGRKALNLVKKEKVKLIITDIMMPEIDGLDFLKQLRDFNWETRVIILSGYDRFDFAQSAMRHGASEYLLKPVSNEELEEAVKRVLRQNIPKPIPHQESLNQKHIRNMYFSRNIGEDEYPPMPSCAFVCAVKLNRMDPPLRYAVSWASATQSGLLPSKAIVFDEDASSALIFCPIPSKEEYYQEVERLYEKIILASGLDEKYVVMLAGLPCSTPDDIGETKRQFGVIERMCKEPQGIIYVCDDSHAKGMRPEIRNAIDYIQYNYARNLTLNEVAEKVHLSPNYLSDTFKREVGENISVFQMRTRIERSAIMLRAGQKYVYQAASAVGYHDVVYYSKLFRRIKGCTPQEYIQKMGGS